MPNHIIVDFHSDELWDKIYFMQFIVAVTLISYVACIQIGR